MRIAELLERRKESWKELERMCDWLEERRFVLAKNGEEVVRFSSLYRSTCTDLSLAEQYQLPPSTVEYLHRLVGRSHRQLYRSRRVPWDRTLSYFSLIIPHAIFRDICVLVAGCLFFGMFTFSSLFAVNESLYPNYAHSVLGDEQIRSMENMYNEPIGSSSRSNYLLAAGFYIKHNTGIGLQCYALGPLVLPTICIVGYNGMILGASFGYMIRPEVDQGKNFLEFVTAHGTFELTAIALAAAAGLRVGLGLFATEGLTRIESLRLNAERSIPIVICSVMLFVMAAFVEGCLSASPLNYIIKSCFAILSSIGLVCYFVLLGYPTQERLADLAVNEDNPWRNRFHGTR